MKRKTEITIQTRRVLIVRRRGERTRLWCGGCAASVEMLTPERAAAATGLSQRAIFRLVEADLRHATETTDGRLFVCLSFLWRHATAAWETST